MKKIYIKIALILSILTLMSVSCKKDFLDQKPTSTLNELNYFKTVDELENGLVSCYAGLKINFDVICWIIGDLGSDDADAGSTHSDEPDLYNISYSRQIASSGFIDYWGAWFGYYLVIGRCNEVIDRSTGTQGDAGKIEKIVDQAKFLRALMFYHLVTEFGDVPLVNKFLSPDKLNLKRAPADSVWNQVESDLIDATNLPTKNEWNQSGRITSGAAWSLLGKTYLTQRKYELANSAFDKVVQSGQYTLVPDYGFIFRLEGENCDESIFEMQTKDIPGQNLGTYSVIWRLPKDPNEGWGFDCPTIDLLNEFEPGDPRIIYTFMFPGDVFPGYLGGTPYTVQDYLSPTGYNSRKAWVPHNERDNLGGSDMEYNCRYMRYAEVLLLYAESLNEANKSGDALYYLNKVRARARNTPTTDPQRISCAYNLSYAGTLLPDVTTTDQTILRQAIWHEQRVELALEGQRRHTLLRTGRFINRMNSAKAYAGVAVQPYQLLLPIPASEIELSNHVLTQNPGY
jgi:starch-binding outer membrane protein, SusD/RagB family